RTSRSFSSSTERRAHHLCPIPQCRSGSCRNAAGDRVLSPCERSTCHVCSSLTKPIVRSSSGRRLLAQRLRGDGARLARSDPWLVGGRRPPRTQRVSLEGERSARG